MSCSTLQRPLLVTALSTAMVLTAVAAFPLNAQPTRPLANQPGASNNQSDNASSPSTAPSPGSIYTEGGKESSSDNSTGATSISGTDSGTPISNTDRNLMRDLAAANLAEIKMGEMAQALSKNPAVRNYAQRMMDDHSRALDQLRQMADAKGVILPGGADRKHAALLNRLASVSGEEFDREYMAHAGLNDHAESRQLLERVAQQATDPQLKQHASQMLGIVMQHLQMAEQLTGTNAASAAEKTPSTGSPAAGSAAQSGK